MIRKIFRTFSMIMILSVVVACVPGMAQQKGKPQQHIVKAGETLYRIAREYHVSVHDLRNWNHLTGNQIQVGQQLWVSAPGRQAPESSSIVTHPVQPGETLFSIAQQYGVTVEQVKTWNNLPGNTISVGQILKIHTKVPAGMQPPPPKTTFLSGNSGQTQIYTVKKGDYLTLIARRFNMTVAELKKLNHLHSDVLHVGQRLRITGGLTAPSIAENAQASSPQGRFATYEVKRDEPLSAILKKFRMDKEDFQALNPDFQGDQLQRGERILLLLPPTVHHANPYRVDNRMQGITLTPVREYPDDAADTPTTSGELYNPDALTAGHSTLPLGKVVYVENPENGKGLYVVINDRIAGDYIKLSRKAYNQLGLTSNQPGVKITEIQ